MSKIVEAPIVKAPEEVIAPIAVFVPLVLLKVIIAYVFAGINWPPAVAVNSTVPAMLAEVVENAGLVVVLVFNVPLFVRELLHVNLHVDMSNTVEVGIVNAPEETIAPIAVFVPLELLKVSTVYVFPGIN